MHNNEFRRFLSLLIRFGDMFLPMFFWVLMIFSFADISTSVITIIAAVIHEAGHILFRFNASGEAVFPKGALNGLRIKNGAVRSYDFELWYAAFGPMFNLAAGAIAVLFFGHSNGYAELFAAVNFTTALSNLLPIEGYDGYKIIYCIFSKTGSAFLYDALYGFSYLLIVFLAFLSLYLMLKIGSGYWIFALFLIALIKNTGKELAKKAFYEI